MMNKIRLLLLCGLLIWPCLACHRAPTETASQPARGEPIAITIIPALNQKVVYSGFSQTTAETINQDPKENEHRKQIGMDEGMMEPHFQLETQVTEARADGNWKQSHKLTLERLRFQDRDKTFTDEKLEGHENMNYSFAAVYGRDGSLIDLPNEAGSLMWIFGQVNPVLLLPTALLPKQAVRVGESWPIEMSRSVPDEGHTEPWSDRLNGTGVVKEIRDGQAIIEFEYTVDSQRFGKPATTQKVKSNVAFDLQKGQFISNHMEIVCETLGWAFSDNETDIKSIFNSLVNVERTKP
jgi:hypothetical protein